MDSNRASLGPDASGPPLVPVMEGLRGWVALVLAVCDATRISHIDILDSQPGRVRSAVVEARRLLAWAFMEVADAPTAVTAAWLEQFTGLARRTVVSYWDGEAPAALPLVLACYNRLMVAMSDQDVWCGICAGLVGQPLHRARRWPRGFHLRLGLRG